MRSIFLPGLHTQISPELLLLTLLKIRQYPENHEWNPIQKVDLSPLGYTWN